MRTVWERLDGWLALHGELPPRGGWIEIAREIGVTPEALYRELARNPAGPKTAEDPRLATGRLESSVPQSL